MNEMAETVLVISISNENDPNPVPSFVGRVILDVPIFREGIIKNATFIFDIGTMPTQDEIVQIVGVFREKMAGDEIPDLKGEGYQIVDLESFRKNVAQVKKVNVELSGKQIFEVSGEPQ